MSRAVNRFGTLILWALASVVFSVPLSSTAAGEPPGETQNELVRVEQVEVLLSGLGPVVLLKVQDRAIPIFVDIVVARSIEGALRGQEPGRPLSHDLMRTILEAFGAKVTQAIITLKDDTYYAALTVVLGDAPKVFDSRSSDAIALAIHFKAPILVSQSLVDSAGKELRRPNERKL